MECVICGRTVILTAAAALSDGSAAVQWGDLPEIKLVRFLFFSKEVLS